jgi:hypothetical protein
MAKTKLPDPLRRRHMVEQTMDPARALRIAEAYLEEGRVIESLTFLVKAEARERLESLRDQAVRDGDAFLLREIAVALKEEVDAASWRALADVAEAAGKDCYASEASRQAARLED